MITKEKIKIFAYYKADVDDFGHGIRSHRKKSSDEDFFLIGNFIQDIRLINKNLVSKKNMGSVEAMLKKSCGNEGTIFTLKQLSLQSELL